LLVDLAAMQDVRTMLYFALKLVIEEE
jgi:hypothetical protein